MLQRVIVWMYRRNITAFEWIMGSLLAWWGVACWVTHREIAAQTRLYLQMTDVAPWWVWVAASFCPVIMVIAFLFTQKWLILYLSLVWKASYWAVMAVITWQAGHSLLTPSLIVAFALGPIFRYADIRVTREERGY